MTLPPGWTPAAFGEIFDFKGGSQPPKSEFKDHPAAGYVRLLQIRDFESDAKAVYIKDEPRWPKCSTDDIMIGRYGASVGKVLSGKNGAYNVALVRMVFDSEKLDRNWVRHFLESEHFQNPLTAISRSAQNGFNKGDLEELVVPLPPLGEQRRIVAKLDALTARVTRARIETDKISKLNEKYKQAILSAAFDGDLTAEWRSIFNVTDVWEKKTIGQVARIASGQTPKEIERSLVADGELAWFKVSSMNEAGNLQGLMVSKFCLSKSSAKSLGLKIYEKGSIAFPKRGGAIATNKKRRLLVAGALDLNLMVLTATGVSAEFLWWWMQKLDLAAISNGSAVPQINNGDIEPLEIYVPSLDEQSEIVRIISAAFTRADRLEAEVARSRKLLDRLESAILAKAFRGELVPQDPNDEPASVLLDQIRTSRGEMPSKKIRRQTEGVHA